MGNLYHHSILKKVVAASVAGFFILISCFYYGINIQQSQELKSHLDDHMKMLSKEISSNIAVRTGWMESIFQQMKQSAGTESLVHSFLERDRKTLYRLASDFYQPLKQRNRVTHLYFIDMQRTVVLRMHQPGRFGDVIERGTAREAEETGSVISGVEVGPLGTLTLRVVMPWRYQGKRIGYLEMGIEMQDILHSVASDRTFSIFLMLKKELLNSADWQDGQQMMGRHNNWSLLDHDVIAFPSDVADLENQMITDYLSSAGNVQKPYMVEVKGITYGLLDAPFMDASGDEVGRLLLQVDLSKEHIGLRDDMYFMMALLGIVMVIIVALLCLIVLRAEKAGAVAESRLKLASEALANTVEGVMITDEKGHIVDVNQAFERVSGYSRDEVIGNSPSMLQSGCQDKAFYEQMWHSIDETGTWHGRIVNRRKNGELYTERLSITAIKAGDAKVSNYIGIFSDVSEEDLLEEQAHERNKMESLNTLIGGIAHEFNNMLAGMTGNLYLARSELDASSRTSERLMLVEKLAFNASDIIHRLLAFTSQDILSKTMINILPIVRQAMDAVHDELPEQTQLNMQHSHASFVVEVDQSQLLQIVINLITNAADAVKQADAPEINLNVDSFVADESFIVRHADVICMKMVRLTVSDNGCGISETDMKYIFDPFYTTKEVGDGPGLGLSMAYGAMKSYGGAIEVESSEAVGTSVHLYFPVDKPDKMLNDSEEMVSGKGETILLVDDDVLVLDTSCRVLKKLGYQVIRASNGQEALSCYRESLHDIDLVMLDVVMPVMGGVEAAIAIRAINPDVKLLFATGFDVKEKLNDQISMRGDLVLSKPYNIKKLSHVLYETLYPDAQDIYHT